MKKLISVLLVATILFAVALPFASAADDKTTFKNNYEKLELLEQMLLDYGCFMDESRAPIEETAKALDWPSPESAEFRKKIENNEYFDLFAKKMYALNDEYSYYWSAEDYAEAYTLDDSFIGIGVELYTRFDGVFVKKVFPGSSADQQGLRTEDRIAFIDGKNVEGLALSDIVSLLRGEMLTDVSVGVRRRGYEKPLTFRITRAAVSVSNITASANENGVGYLKISHFGGLGTYFDFVNEVLTLFEQCNSLVIDLRDNGGGDLGCMINILNVLVPDENVLLCKTVGRVEDANEEYYSTGNRINFDNYCVLINENSASAAEYFAGQMRELLDATVIGKTSYGKGVGQNHFALADQSYSVITILELYLAGDKCYNGVGIVPDIEVEAMTKERGVPDLPSYSGKTIWRYAVNRDVLAAKERLSLLGYYYGSMDKLCNDALMNAAKSFATDHGLSCSATKITPALLSATDAEIAQYAKEPVEYDKALEIATDLLLEEAKVAA